MNEGVAQTLPTEDAKPAAQKRAKKAATIQTSPAAEPPAVEGKKRLTPVLVISRIERLFEQLEPNERMAVMAYFGAKNQTYPF